MDRERDRVLVSECVKKRYFQSRRIVEKETDKLKVSS